MNEEQNKTDPIPRAVLPYSGRGAKYGVIAALAIVAPIELFLLLDGWLDFTGGGDAALELVCLVPIFVGPILLIVCVSIGSFVGYLAENS